MLVKRLFLAFLATSMTVVVMAQTIVVSEKAGSLCEKVRTQKLDTCDYLIVRGPLNSMDIRVLRALCGHVDDTFQSPVGKVRLLDLVEAKFVSDKEPYSVVDMDKVLSFCLCTAQHRRAEYLHYTFFDYKPQYHYHDNPRELHPRAKELTDRLGQKKYDKEGEALYYFVSLSDYSYDWIKRLKCDKFDGHQLTFADGKGTMTAFIEDGKFCMDMFYDCPALKLLSIDKNRKYNKMIYFKSITLLEHESHVDLLKEGKKLLDKALELAEQKVRKQITENTPWHPTNEDFNRTYQYLGSTIRFYPCETAFIMQLIDVNGIPTNYIGSIDKDGNAYLQGETRLKQEGFQHLFTYSATSINQINQIINYDETTGGIMIGGPLYEPLDMPADTLDFSTVLKGFVNPDRAICANPDIKASLRPENAKGLNAIFRKVEGSRSQDRSETYVLSGICNEDGCLLDYKLTPKSSTAFAQNAISRIKYQPDAFLSPAQQDGKSVKSKVELTLTVWFKKGFIHHAAMELDGKSIEGDVDRK